MRAWRKKRLDIPEVSRGVAWGGTRGLAQGWPGISQNKKKDTVLWYLGLMLTEEEDQVSNGRDFRLLESWAAPGYFFQAEYPVMLPEDLAHYSN